MKIVYIHFAALPSTNDYLKEHLEELDETVATVVSANTQTKGRGTFGKTWVSPAGKNLYASVAFFLEEGSPKVATLAIEGARIASEVLQTFQIDAQIKSPNDLMLGGKKIGGILVETREAKAKQAVILGIGLNCQMSEEDMAKISQPATSIEQETGIVIEPKNFRELFFKSLLAYVSK